MIFLLQSITMNMDIIIFACTVEWFVFALRYQLLIIILYKNVFLKGLIAINIFFCYIRIVRQKFQSLLSLQCTMTSGLRTGKKVFNSNKISFTLYVHSRVAEGTQCQDTLIPTCCRILGGRTQHRALLRHQSEEMEI